MFSEKFKPTLAQKAGVVAATGYIALGGSNANAAGGFYARCNLLLFQRLRVGFRLYRLSDLLFSSLVVVVKAFQMGSISALRIRDLGKSSL